MGSRLHSLLGIKETAEGMLWQWDVPGLPRAEARSPWKGGNRGELSKRAQSKPDLKVCAESVGCLCHAPCDSVDCVLQLWVGLKGTQGGSAPSLTPETHAPAKVQFQKGENQD